MTPPPRPRLDWRSLDRASLDKAYNNAAAVANSAAMVAAWEHRSALLRQQYGGVFDLCYGPRPRNRIDFLKSGTPAAPTLIFLHGGYWQMRSKDAFTFVASGPLSAGINVALVGYTLAPEVSMDEMVSEIRRALDWLASDLPGLGAVPSKIILSGWSARRAPRRRHHGSPVRPGNASPSAASASFLTDAALFRQRQASSRRGRRRAQLANPATIITCPTADNRRRRRGSSIDVSAVGRLRCGTGQIRSAGRLSDTSDADHSSSKALSTATGVSRRSCVRRLPPRTFRRRIGDHIGENIRRVAPAPKRLSRRGVFSDARRSAIRQPHRPDETPCRNL